ncbi:HD domain-containing phosphohydrolase [Neobacillus sp. 3P2-tot-E-2]|uniref:HD-GYP domain-containing protein n=1 Tax=Neobacillus sp. 3P2-tot-E-2 TaxID=3132212 RepID=UPI00399F0127
MKQGQETGNHVRRVAEYSQFLALKYGLQSDEIELLKLASPLHDIGKVAIPDSILNKPGKLTNEEFDIIKTHTEIGYQMLKHSNTKLMETAAIIAYTHHEKYDGTGYPRGLKEQEIPLYGRITTVSDVFDALSSERVYKKPWEIKDIIDYFKCEKGKHFDPILVEIVLNNVNEFLRIKEKFKD